MSSDDDSDFLSSADDISDDDQTMKIPSGGSGTEPANATPAATSVKSTPLTSTAARGRQLQGNLLTDMFQYITFQDCMDHPQSSSSQESEEDTTPLSYRRLNALEHGPTKASPPDYGSLTPPASVAPISDDQTRADSSSATLCDCQYHHHDYCASSDGEGRTKHRQHRAPVFRVLFMLVVLLVCLFIILSVLQAPQCRNMYGFEVSHWWCF